MTAFFKVSGGGNDFLALPEPDAPPAPGQIRAWCRRGVSLGADGLFVLRRKAPARDGARVEMDYYNADGRAADLCLNGTRCAAQLAFHLGWAAAAERVVVETAAGPVGARRLDGISVALELAPPAPPEEVTVEVEGRNHLGWRVDAGVPHFVLLWPGDLEAAPVVALGRPLRHHPLFQPAGTNVDFASFPASHRLRIRTYERGVEDETLACGTGVMAAAAVGLALGNARLPLAAETRGGFELRVDRAGADSASGTDGRWTLSGDARLVAQGRLLPGAQAPDSAATAETAR